MRLLLFTLSIHYSRRLLATLFLGVVIPIVTVAEPTQSTNKVSVGHSYHGEAFNEGPRQSATLVKGLAEIDFPTSTKNRKAQQFFEQGVAQLHGFWFLEAERSFRQAAKLDPDMAIAYWGMAMANTNNDDRARGIIDQAMETMGARSTSREKLYIKSLERFIPPAVDEDEAEPEPSEEDSKEAKVKRNERYISDLEDILHEYPDDIEAKAFLVVQLWKADREGVKLSSHYAVDALLSEIFAASPGHPAHHYRIHLWDKEHAKNALVSCAQCGPSMPAVAHMWHMPGHIYSKLKRYNDAAWQQEASARVDHAHMARARLIPDQIHNFAHNNEWLIRNLLFLGRVNDAITHSKNLVSLPQHPSFNTLEKRGSFKYGRMRLYQTLTQYALWEQLLEESGGSYLSPTSDKTEQAEWLGWMGVAHYQTGNPQRGSKTMRSLKRRRIAIESALLDLADEAARHQSNLKKGEDQSVEDNSLSEEPKSETAAELRKRLASIRTVIARVGAAAAAHRHDAEKTKLLGEKAKLEKLILASWIADAGDLDTSIRITREHLKKNKNRVRPLAILAELLWKKGDQVEAQKHFKELRRVAAYADLGTPILGRLSCIADSLELKGDWRIQPKPADDLGHRPRLATLGPATWQRYRAPSWTAKLPDGTVITSKEFSGKPRLLIFYLGFGCLHCVEQLHAFSPMIDQYRDAGIEVMAISTEDVDSLATGLKDFNEPIAIALMADPKQSIFKKYRCWDDFEQQPLHGTFLIDGEGFVRWQDIGHEPFTKPKFLLEESKRLLDLP